MTTLTGASPDDPARAPTQRNTNHSKRGGARLRLLLLLFALTLAVCYQCYHYTTVLTAGESSAVQGSGARHPSGVARGEGSGRDECLRDLRRHNAAYLRKHIRQFWGSADYVEVLLRLMGRETFARDFDVFVDVGAGSYAKKGGDISLSFVYDTAFPAAEKTVLAFEPFPGSYDRLAALLAEHRAEYGRDDRSLRYILKNVGCGASKGTMRFLGQRSYMTANRRIALHPWYSGRGEMEINSTTVDIAIEEAGAGAYVNVLKTDTEGLELEVLLGASRLLKERRIDLIVFAYEDKWTWDSFAAAYPVPGTVAKDQLTFDTPNLQSVSTWLDALGYKSYLLGSANRGKEKGFVALPVTAEYWDDAFEVARDPKGYGVHPTWMDAIAVKEGSALQDWIEQQSSPYVRVDCA